MKTFQEDQFYHIYNRGTEGITIFNDKEDYERFLQKMAYYLFPVWEVYAFCLLPNHFHLMARVRTEDEQQQLFQMLKQSQTGWKPFGQKYDTFKLLNPGSVWAHCKNSHTKYYNHKYERSGSLFEGKYRRKVVQDLGYFVRLISYIHLNPVRHGLRATYEDYPYSSYGSYLDNKPSILPKSKVLSWFGGVPGFEYIHQQWCELDGSLEQGVG
jgi:REP element-mobilizing transposase RayT